MLRRHTESACSTGFRGDERPACGTAFAQEQLPPFDLPQTTPDPVRLLYGHRVLTALHQHGAGLADRLGPRLAPLPRRTSLVVGVEEEAAVRSPAGTAQLPLPFLRDHVGQPADVGHVVPPFPGISMSSATCPPVHGIKRGFGLLTPRASRSAGV